MKITLPLPPSINHAYGRCRNGRNFIKPEGRGWILHAQLVTGGACFDNKWKYSEKEKIVIEIFVFWPDNRKRDCSNLEKILIDSLQDIVFEDDRYALVRFMDFEVDRENPRVELTIYKK